MSPRSQREETNLTYKDLSPKFNESSHINDVYSSKNSI
jgi:hypothetical protein